MSNEKSKRTQIKTMKKLLFYTLLITASMDAMDKNAEETKPIIKPYEQEHKSAVWSLYRQTFPNVWNHPNVLEPSRISSHIENANIIVKPDNTFMGFIIYQSESPDEFIDGRNSYDGTNKNIKATYINFIAIESCYRKQKCGSLLMQHVEAIAHQNNEDYIYVKHTEASAAFYRNLGYIHVRGSRVVDVFMVKPLTQRAIAAYKKK